GVAVDQLRRVGDRAVDRDDLAVDRREQLGDALGRLDLAEDVARAHLPADLGQVDEHDVPELVLRVLGDAHPDERLLAGGDPLVFLGVAKLFRSGHRRSPFMPSLAKTCWAKSYTHAARPPATARERIAFSRL